MSGPDLHVFTFKFLAQKTGFSPIKNTFQIFFDFCLPLFYATFQFGRYNTFKKYINLFFAHENLKKWASKVAHNRPKLFFSQSSQDLIFHIINMSQDASVLLSVNKGTVLY